MKKARWMVVGAAVLLCLAAGFRYVQLNRRYPPPITETYTMSQPVSYNSFQITVERSAFLADDQIQTVLAEEVEEGYEPKIIVLDVTITNKADTEHTLDLTPFVLQSGAWKNGIHMLAFLRLNDTSANQATLNPSLKPGESRSLRLPFSMLSSNFAPQKWDSVEQREYSLVLSLYPIKQTILCTT